MSDNQTIWVPSKDGGITVKRRGQEYWATVFVWSNSMPQGLTEYQVQNICDWMNKAYQYGRAEAFEDVRALIGAK